MALPADYVSGTITLTAGSTEFTGTGTGWLAADFREGDIILDVLGGGNRVAVVAAVTGNGAGTLTKPWEGPTLANVAYRLRYQWDSGRVSAQTRTLIEQLGNGNLQSLAAVTGAAGNVVVFNGPGAIGIEPRTNFINGVAYDVQVNTLADRAAYNGQSAGFTVLVSNVGDGRSAVYSKATNASGDWTNAAYVTGPVGPEFDVTVGPTTTLAPDQPASVSPVAIPGGVRLDFAIPRGPTGDISGVTPFWNARLGADTTAAQARVGLGAAGVAESEMFRGLKYATNATYFTNALDISPGICRDALNQHTIVIPSTLVKGIDSPWSQGSSAGGLDTPTITNGWYHIHAIYNPTTNVSDVLFSASMLSPNLPTGFTSRRWIGAVSWFGGSIFPFINNGDRVQYKTPVASVSGQSNTTTPTMRNLGVPTGAKVEAELTLVAYATSAVGGSVIVRDPDLGTYTTSAELGSWYYAGAGPVVSRIRQMTDNLGRVLTSDTNTAGTGFISLRAEGWRIDRSVYL